MLVLQADCYNWLATLMRARSNDGAWTQYTYDVSAFAGQDIVIYFNAINDGIGGQRTWMYVDDVQAEIDVGTVIIKGGVVDGNVRAMHSIELYVPARVSGTLHSPEIFMDKGVHFSGTCTMAPL